MNSNQAMASEFIAPFRIGTLAGCAQHFVQRPRLMQRRVLILLILANLGSLFLLPVFYRRQHRPDTHSVSLPRLHSSEQSSQKHFLTYPICDNRTEHFVDPYPPCRIGHDVMVCTKLPENSQSEAWQPAPHKLCLPGHYSWNHCTEGRFLCACFINFQSTSWQQPCPTLKWVEHVIPTNADFAHSNYRLGNIIDKWFSKHISRDEPISTKFHSEFQEMVASAPRHSFGRFLFEHTPKVVSTLTDFRNTAFIDNFMTFWVYSYEAIAVAQDQYRKMMNEAIESYAHQVGYRMPAFNLTECVIHYRLGDMLSIGAIEPLHFAASLHNWTQHENINVTQFYVLVSGISHAASEKQRNFSHYVIDTFCGELMRRFPSSSVVQDMDGTPDDDWFKMVHAPLLFTTHGSYATTAAAANSGIRLSPAVPSADNPMCGVVPSRFLSSGWWLFDCKNLVDGVEARVIITDPFALPQCVHKQMVYTCLRVRNFAVTSVKTPSPHPSCLGGKYSWNTCKEGKFLCQMNTLLHIDAYHKFSECLGEGTTVGMKVRTEPTTLRF